ncbi:MAG: hypothetical protein IJ480_08155 [Clostridia bacterium]|nr:hypothetical protein [Clostridia bacterium]
MNEQLQSHYKPPRPVSYALLTLGVHLGTGGLMWILFANSYSTNLMVRHTIAPVVTCVLPLFVMIRYYLSLTVPAQYREDGRWTWIRSFLKLVLPGEVIRMVISLIGFGALPLGSYFSPFSWLMTEKLYMYPKMQLAGNSAAAVRIMSASHTLYFAFYLLYLTLTYLPVLLVCYRIYWNRGQREYEHLKKVYAEHEADAAARDAMPEVELKVIPEHKSKVFAAYNSFRGKRPKK